MGRPANYEIVDQTPKAVLIKDLGPWSRHFTITNDAEGVVLRMSPILKGRRLYYFDSDGDLTELVIENGHFKGFRYGPDIIPR